MEAVIVIPVIMLVLLVLVQVTLWARAAQVVHLAASEGDRAALSAGSVASGVSRASAVLATSGSAVESPVVQANREPGDQISMTVTGRALSLLPWMSLPVSATRIGPIQEFRASG